jgi:DNA-binding CsgD family transcriptional regulator
MAAEIIDLGSRAKVLECFVEIVLAEGDIAAGRSGADELREIAERFGAPQLDAMAARANGMALLGEGNQKAALAEFHRSWKIWCDLDAPYEAARTRVWMSHACVQMNDCDSAKLELELAREVFERLGAKPDLLHTNFVQAKPGGSQSSLTAREIEVLKLVASGKTNRAIAAALKISEKTVARHVSNIFNKLNLSSRAAATAFAYQHKLV